MEILRKITTSQCNLSTDVLNAYAESHKDAVTPVLRVYGGIRSSKLGKSAYGEYFVFEGQFEAVNLITNTAYRSKKLILPDVGAEALQVLLDNVKAKDKEAMGQFGMDVCITYNAASSNRANSTKFRWSCKPLIDIKTEGDYLSKLGKSFGALPLIEVPKSK